VREIFTYGELAEGLPREIRGVTAKHFECTRQHRAAGSLPLRIAEHAYPAGSL